MHRTKSFLMNSKKKERKKRREMTKKKHGVSHHSCSASENKTRDKNEWMNEWKKIDTNKLSNCVSNGALSFVERNSLEWDPKNTWHKLIFNSIFLVQFFFSVFSLFLSLSLHNFFFSHSHSSFEWNTARQQLNIEVIHVCVCVCVFVG